MSRLIDPMMAIPAIESKFAYVETVVVRNRLGRLVANPGILRRSVIIYPCRYPSAD